MSDAYSVDQQDKQKCEANMSSSRYAAASGAKPEPFILSALAVEHVIPGISLTLNFTAWTKENLRAYGFTHIIIIDKHIQELFYPSPVFKLASPDIYDDLSPFEFYPTASSALTFGMDFEAIDLNFGEKSYLTTVLPNCYRAVKFINMALKGPGKVLVIDCNGGEQKCVTIVVAYLMFKHNITFSNAFARLKKSYEKADLDRFFMSQLYEYEPILQVQRAQSCGHSCSRELNAGLLKRKKLDDDFSVDDLPPDTCSKIGDDNSELNLYQINPLAQFNVAQQQQKMSSTERLRLAVAEQNNNTYDDYDME